MYKRGVQPHKPTQNNASLGTQFEVAASRVQRNFSKKIKLKKVSSEPFSVILGVALCGCAFLSVVFLITLIGSSMSYPDPQEKYLEEMKVSKSYEDVAKDQSWTNSDAATQKSKGKRKSKRESKKKRTVSKKTNPKVISPLVKEGRVETEVVPPSNQEAETSKKAVEPSTVPEVKDEQKPSVQNQVV